MSFISIKIGRYNFDGPYASFDLVEDRPGLYALVDEVNGEYSLIDIGEAENIRSSLVFHERRACWRKYFEGKLRVAVYYTPAKQQPERIKIEQEIRDYFSIPCGRKDLF